MKYIIPVVMFVVMFGLFPGCDGKDCSGKDRQCESDQDDVSQPNVHCEDGRCYIVEDDDEDAWDKIPEGENKPEDK